MATQKEALRLIQARARPAEVQAMARFGLGGQGRLGLSVPDMRAIAKSLGRDHALALDLWDTGIPDAMIVAGMIADPAKITSASMDAWVKDFMAWDVCDQVCMNLFEKSPLAWKKIAAWSRRKEEFVRRAAFALLACLAWHDKHAADEQFIAAFPILQAAADDNRNYVKKAVNWALRNIGKRNLTLYRQAVRFARELAKMDSPSARWIAADALKELTSPAVKGRIKKSENTLSTPRSRRCVCAQPKER